jgi:plastocyanin
VEEEVPCDKIVTETHIVNEELAVEMRTHSLHPHGFAFLAAHDGAYPLSPPDKSQPVGSEQPLWDLLNVKKFKKGDRVPPAATFDYTWIAGAPSEADPNTIEAWPTTAGVWLYHDHSICDMDNVNLGAIGIIVIHNPQDAELEVDIRRPNDPDHLDPAFLPGGLVNGPLIVSGVAGGKFYVPPPGKALYLQLFHTLTGTQGGMLMNGRQYLGNTPTLITGPETLMRFGVVGMGPAEFHTFHIHGHRWIIPGPDGSDQDTIQNSPQIRAVSQFEDTRIFGPANSFVFSIREGEFFGARDDDPAGEYHMHCHVLTHMDMGMMGSLLLLPAEGGPASDLPEGVPCPGDIMAPMDQTIEVLDSSFSPQTISVAPNAQVTFKFTTFPHTVETTAHTNADPIEITKDPNGSPGDVNQAIPAGQERTVTIQGTSGGKINFQCGIHLFPGTINIA